MISKKPTFIEYLSTKGLTMNDVAEKLGISYSSMMNKVNDRQEFTQRELQILKDVILRNQPLIFEECFMHCYCVGSEPIQFWNNKASAEKGTIMDLILGGIMNLNAMLKKNKEETFQFLCNKAATSSRIEGLIIAYNVISNPSDWIELVYDEKEKMYSTRLIIKE